MRLIESAKVKEVNPFNWNVVDREKTHHNRKEEKQTEYINKCKSWKIEHK